jgi:hypothetical protein
MTEADILLEKHGVQQRGGKKYLEVKHRVTVFRRAYGANLGIETEVIDAGDKYVRVRAVIRDKLGNIVASGLAEEVRGTSPVNKGSALENCETSAIGRALACFGLHGGEYASLNEIVNHQEKVRKIDELNKLVTEEPAQNTTTPLERCIEDIGGEVFEGVKALEEKDRTVFDDFARQAFTVMDKEMGSDAFRALVAEYKGACKANQALSEAVRRIIEYYNSQFVAPSFYKSEE